VKLTGPGTRPRWPPWVTRPLEPLDRGCLRIEWSWDRGNRNPRLERPADALTAFLKIGDDP
jgi:hypothetical protein